MGHLDLNSTENISIRQYHSVSLSESEENVNNTGDSITGSHLLINKSLYLFK